MSIHLSLWTTKPSPLVTFPQADPINQIKFHKCPAILESIAQKFLVFLSLNRGDIKKRKL